MNVAIPVPPPNDSDDAATRIRATALPTNLSAGFAPLAQFAERKQDISRALVQLEQAAGPHVARALIRLKRDMDMFEPSVTVLGQVKSGKTSLVNALAGWSDLLPCDVNPWTSVVTSLHLKPGRARGETAARFQFMSEREWDRLLVKGGRIGEMAGRAGAEGELQQIRSQIEAMRDRSKQRLGRKFELLMGQVHDYGYFDKNLIERYICLGDDLTLDAPIGQDQGRFADITRAADLSLNSEVIPHALCLRDTPGVNDTFMMREQITIQAIRGSGLCVVVLSAGQALTSVDLSLIRMLATLDSREVVIFVNRIDELADPSRQVPEIETAIRETLRTHHGPQEAEILFGSAFWANAALTGDVETLPPASAAALLNWAKAPCNAPQLSQANPTGAAQDLVWSLSGMPALNQVLSERTVARGGAALLKRVAASALAAASGLEASLGISVGAGKNSADPARSVTGAADLMTAFLQLKTDQMRAFEQEIETVQQAFRERAERTHATFLDRATQALITHLERNGDQVAWKYDPTGLRVLLRTAYSVMSSRLHTAAEARHTAAVHEVAKLLFDHFGQQVQGVQLGVPQVADITPPVALGQTLALDFQDGWWANWWRRTRGYDAFADTFRALIDAETEDFMQQVKKQQLADLKADFLQRLQGFFDEMGDILKEMSSAHEGELRARLTDSETHARTTAIHTAMESLRNYVA